MEKQSSYQVCVTVTNEMGEVFEKKFNVPAGTRPWFMIRHDSPESLFSHFLSQLRTKMRENVHPGWLG